MADVTMHDDFSGLIEDLRIEIEAGTKWVNRNFIQITMMALCYTVDLEHGDYGPLKFDTFKARPTVFFGIMNDISG